MKVTSVIPLLSLFWSQCQAAWPNTPFKTSGRDILGADGTKIVYAGVNWPGAADTMLPEGLQYSSVANIVSRIKNLGMNVIRLTYAIEMVDDYLGNSPNQTLKNTLIHALGQQNGATVLNQILKNNPSFTESTTRLQVFDAVAAECANQQIWVHLDNHVSKAQWCCSQTDGNAWFSDRYFNVNNWQRGLGFMANRAKSWKALASMSLRNELRSVSGSSNAQPYNWQTWVSNMMPAAKGINGNNSLPLIFLSGLNYDTDDSLITKGQAYSNGQNFKLSDYAYSNKLVFELHNYQNGATACSQITSNLYNGGYGAMNLSDSSFPNHAPVVLTEFGFNQGDNSASGVYAQCLKQYLTSGIPGGPGGFMQWVIAGSYYIREGTQDSDETWGLVNHAWSDWRNTTVINSYDRPLVSGVLN